MLQIIITTVIFALAKGTIIPPATALFANGNPFTPQGRIVGGVETTIEEHPWQVSVQALGFHVCGGSIVSRTVVLTAGHCMSYRPSWLSARVGSSVMQSGGSVHRVTEFLRHPDYRTNSQGIPENDVAIVRLRTPIDLGRLSRPVPLFSRDEAARPGALATITGWGTVIEGGSMPEVLRTASVPVVDKAVCNEAYAEYGGLPEGQICAAYPAGGKDTCQGDSGGPLVIGGRQAGIVSWGNGCARKGYPGAYTEIAFFRDWIAEQAGV